MAYCTNCGASVEGAFCSQCGKPVAQPAAATAAPARRKTSIFVWMLVVVLGVALVGGIAVVTGGLWLAHRAREAGVDADLFRDNPGLAIAKLVTAANPDAEIVSTDIGAGTVTVRDRRSGKQITVTFDQVRKGNFRFEASDDNGRHTVLDFGGDGVKLPTDLPAYPGAKVQATYEVDGNGDKGQGGYEYEFSTPDAPSKVIDYYHRKLEDAGMTLALNTHTSDGGMLVAQDDAHSRTLRVIVSRDSHETTINVTARVKR
jgi:hypothetical protein